MWKLSRLAAVFCMTAGWLPAFGQPGVNPKLPDPLHEWLRAQGFTAIPLTRVDELGPRYIVKASVGKEQLRLLLDTGAWSSVLLERSANRAKLKVVPNRGAMLKWLHGEKSYEEYILSNFAVGSYSISDGMILVGPIWNSSADKLTILTELDGLLGNPTLDSHAAVIDCARNQLYFTDPQRIDWARLRGEWICVHGERDGKKLADPQKWSVTLSDGDNSKGREYHKAIIRNEDRKNTTEGLFEFTRDSGRKVFAFIAKSETDDLPLFEQLVAAGQYTIENRRLKLCYTTPIAGAKERISPGIPTQFKSTAGSGCAMLEFERVGKAPTQPPRVSETLIRLGYTEVPLVRVGTNGFAFAATVAVGKHRLRWLVDTGASLSVVDEQAVKRIELRSQPTKRLPGVEYADADKGRYAVLPEMRLGTVELPGVAVSVWDLTKLTLDKDDVNQRIDGLLGADMLLQLSAVIDYDQQAIYVISPLDKAWPGLQGEWVCTSGSQDGKALADADQWRFHFDAKGVARMWHAKFRTSTTLMADFRFFGQGRSIVTLDRVKASIPAPLPFKQDAIWMNYAIDGDKLKVAYFLDPKNTAQLADRVPLTLEPKAGVVVLEFTRQPKPPEKK